MIKAYINVFRNYANFSGTLHRKPYWQAIIIHLLVFAVPLYPLVVTANDFLTGEENLFLIILSALIVYCLLSFIPFCAATVRRLHDLPKSGWFLALSLIPAVGPIIVIGFLLQKGHGEEAERTIVRLLPEIKAVLARPQKGGWFWAAVLLLAAGGILIWKFDSPRNIYIRFANVSAALFGHPAPLVFPGSVEAEKTEATKMIAKTGMTIGKIVHEAATIGTYQENDPDDQSVEADEVTAVPINTPDYEPGTILRSTGDGAFVISMTDPAAANGIFWIDMSEVSNNQYHLCSAAGACSDPDDPALLSIEDYYADETNYGEFPVIRVNREQAELYCEWAGRRLPAETEWEMAAAGPEGAAFPWGSAFSSRKLNYAGSADFGTSAVSAYRNGKSTAGALNMLGNVWEWVSNPLDTENDEIGVIRGGGWNSYEDALSTALRYAVMPDYTAPNLGFRCAASEIDSSMYRELNAEEQEFFSELPPDIGSEREREADGAIELYVPETVFIMGNASGAINEKPAHEVTLGTYWIDKTEVSNAQYSQCVSAGVCSDPVQTKSLKNPSYYGNEAFAGYPVIFVTWAQAVQYCEWAGGRLPTEAEWENAARGPDGFLYPWGITFDTANLNYAGSGINDTEPVESYENGASPYGLLNMAGNVAEWVSDRYAEDWYQTSPDQNPAGPEYGAFRVVRGGSWQTGEVSVQSVNRFYAAESSSGLDRGFRCVRPE